MGRFKSEQIRITNTDIVTTRTYVGFNDKSGITQNNAIVASESHHPSGLQFAKNFPKSINVHNMQQQRII